MKIDAVQMMSVIRDAVGRCEGDEHDVLGILLDEAECWRMRYAELEDERNETL